MGFPGKKQHFQIEMIVNWCELYCDFPMFYPTKIPLLMLVFVLGGSSHWLGYNMLNPNE